MIEKTYQPGAVEGRIYAAWEAAGAFRAGRPERAKAQPYCIVIPPPNVTGSLHMGHALNNTLQDILCRFERMRGKTRDCEQRDRARRRAVRQRRGSLRGGGHVGALLGLAGRWR